MIQGLSEIIQALQSISHNPQTERIPSEIAENFREQIVAVGAVDKGIFLQSIDWRETQSSADFQQFLIDSSRDAAVTYDAFVEVGTIKMPARYPAQRGIEQTDLKSSFDAWIYSSLSN
jgi:hypothetical protein